MIIISIIVIYIYDQTSKCHVALKSNYKDNFLFFFFVYFISVSIGTPSPSPICLLKKSMHELLVKFSVNIGSIGYKRNEKISLDSKVIPLKSLTCGV